MHFFLVLRSIWHLPISILVEVRLQCFCCGIILLRAIRRKNPRQAKQIWFWDPYWKWLLARSPQTPQISVNLGDFLFFRMIWPAKINYQFAHCFLKYSKMSHLNLWILAFSTNFCPIKTELSGNTVWPQATGFQKLAKMDNFRPF